MCSILLEGVHQAIPTAPAIPTQVYLGPPPPDAAAAQPQTGAANTEADRIRARYKAIGEAQNHAFGENPPGAKVIDFNAKPAAAPPASAQSPAAQPGGAPPAADQPAKLTAKPPAAKPPAVAPVQPKPDPL